jgi:gas vesicle protein
MDQDRNRQALSFISGLLLGAVIGAGVAYLTAPESGKRTRKRLKRAAVGLRDSASDRLDELADEVKGKVDEVIRSARRSLAG